MNPNDLADFSADSSDTVIRRTVVSDGHRILVVGTIPEQGVPSVAIRTDAMSIEGGMDTMVMLEEALGEVLTDMDDTIHADEQPIPCLCGEEHPEIKTSGMPGNRPWYRVMCPKCGSGGMWCHGRYDAMIAWQELVDDCRERPLHHRGPLPPQGHHRVPRDGLGGCGA